jgi:hypothetical protein
VGRVLSWASIFGLILAGCSEARTLERCPEGQIATVSGCLSVASTARDAATESDAAPRDAAEITQGDAALDGGIAANDAGADAGATDASIELSLTGAWALEIVATDQVTSSSLNTTETVVITTIALVELTQTGQRFQTKTEICQISTTALSEFSTIYPEAAIAVIANQESGGSLSTDANRTRFIAEPRAQILGWTPVLNALTEQLPESEEDPRVVDADNDRNPGVTLEIKGPIGGEIYVASRSIVSLEGTVESSERISGLSETIRKQVTLGASNEILAENQILVVPGQDPNASTFRMARLPTMIEPNCLGIVTNLEQIFR